MAPQNHKSFFVFTGLDVSQPLLLVLIMPACAAALFLVTGAAVLLKKSSIHIKQAGEIYQCYTLQILL